MGFLSSAPAGEPRCTNGPGRYTDAGGIDFQDSRVALEAGDVLKALVTDGTLPSARIPASWLAAPGAYLPVSGLAALQGLLLARVLRRVQASPFYRERFSGLEDRISVLSRACLDLWRELSEKAQCGEDFSEDWDTVFTGEIRSLLAGLPFTSSADLSRDYRSFVCGSQDSADRVVTLPTSGSTGIPKRIAFDAGCLRRTADFFASGMAQIVAPGETLLVCLPGSERPDGVADLLRQGLNRRGTRVAAMSSGADAGAVISRMEELHPHSLVLSPKQLEGIFKIFPDRPPAGLQSFLTSADWCDPSLAARVRDIWRVASIDHYGITESCFGFALECNCHDGYHIRHLDVFCEIVDPLTGRVLDIDPETGRTAVGELVFTTLRQPVMPLVRYRTGDAAYLVSRPCACGSPYSRLGSIVGRFAPGTRDIIHPRKGLRFHPPLGKSVQGSEKLEQGSC